MHIATARTHLRKTKQRAGETFRARPCSAAKAAEGLARRLPMNPRLGDVATMTMVAAIASLARNDAVSR